MSNDQYRFNYSWRTDKIPGKDCFVSCTFITFIAGCGLASINDPSIQVTDGFTYLSQGEVDKYVVEHFFNELHEARKKGNVKKDLYGDCLPSLFVLVNKYDSLLHTALRSGKAGIVTEAPWVKNTYHGDKPGSPLKAYFVIPNFAKEYLCPELEQIRVAT